MTCLLFSPAIIGTVKAKKNKDSRMLLLGVLVWNSFQSAGVSINVRKWYSSATYKRSYYFLFSLRIVSHAGFALQPFPGKATYCNISCLLWTKMLKPLNLFDFEPLLPLKMSQFKTVVKVILLFNKIKCILSDELLQ